MSKFLRQIGFEIKNILMSKFILIAGILVLLISVAAPVIGALSKTGRQDNYYPEPVPYYDSAAYGYGVKMPIDIYPGGSGPITVDGIVIGEMNPFYWNLSTLLQSKKAIEQGNTVFTHPESANIALDLLDAQIAFFMHYVKAGITDYNDYRIQLQWEGGNKLIDKFIYEHSGTDPAVLFEAVQQGGFPLDQDGFNKKYIDITSEQRLFALEAADEYLAKFYDAVDNGNFPAYIDLAIEQQRGFIKNNEDQIAMLQKNIIDNPEQEQYLNEQIESLKKQNESIEKNQIPMLMYRLEKNIVPGLRIWQNTAIADIEEAQNWLIYNVIYTEEQFNEPQNQSLKQQYGSYARYLAEMNAQKNEYVNNELIARKCLDTEKPDMKYVPDGARSQAVQFLSYSVFVALFGVLLGGWIIASEFQSGTIRLLLIRPKTRSKILMAKFFAALIICLLIYAAGCCVNLIANGIFFGFPDYSYPNFTVNGDVSFFASYAPAFLACSVTVIFAFSAAFMLSVLTKNIAVSLIIPVVCFIGCTIVMTYLAFSRLMEWIAYTPIPYVSLYSFYLPHSTSASYNYVPVFELMKRGMPLSAEYGIMILLVLSAACAVVSILAFRKKDITN